MLVGVVQQLARPQLVCFARRPQTLAVFMHHVLLLMVVLSILKVVLAEQQIALLLPMVCFVDRRPILAVLFQWWTVTLSSVTIRRWRARTVGTCCWRAACWEVPLAWKEARR